MCNVMFRNDGRWRAMEAGAPPLMLTGASANHPGRLGHSAASAERSPCLHHPRSLIHLAERAEATRCSHTRAILVGRASSHTSHVRVILSYAERASAICTHQPRTCNPFRSLHSPPLVHHTYRFLHGSGSACLSACGWSSTLEPRPPRQAAECPPDCPAVTASLRPAPSELVSSRFFTGPSN